MTLRVQADKPGPRINPAMWGIFFEDINLGADGGLYAELVKNRSFEFPDGKGMLGWFEVSPTMAVGEAALAEHASGERREPPLPAPAQRGHGSVRGIERGLPWAWASARARPTTSRPTCA